MNCDEFEHNWQGLIADSIDKATQSAMAVHAKTCAACGPRWNSRQEVDSTVQAIIDSHPLPPHVAEDVANEAFQNRFGAAVGFHSDAVSSRDNRPASVTANKATTGLIALLAALIGYLLGSGQSQSNPLQQLYTTQLMYGGGGRGQNISEVMMMAEMAGMGAGRGILPTVTTTIRIICLATLLVWVTRSRFWHQVFPAKLPTGILAARWLALIAALLGIGRCLGYSYVSLTMRSMQRGGGIADTSWMTNSLSLVNQLWGITFWLTVVVLLLTTVDRLVQNSFAMRDEPSQGARDR